MPWPPLNPPPTSDPSFVAGVLARHAARPRTLGLLLVRRGGWAVGVASEGRLLVHKTGSRYVQVTAEFVRRFTGLEDRMKVYSDAAGFDAELEAVTGRRQVEQ